MRTVVFFHQAADLYGSDKVLLNLALELKSSSYTPIVFVPWDGPLVAELVRFGIETHIITLVRISRALFSFKGLISLPLNLAQSLIAVSRILHGRKIDLVHSNTLAVFSGAIWAKLYGIPHLWHVHEILLSPAIVRKGLPVLLRLLAGRIVCNSEMTKKWILDEQPKLGKRTSTIWNGIERKISPDVAEISQIHRTLDSEYKKKIVVVLAGRINHWKGHLLLVEAATLLWHRGYTHVCYVIVGGVYAHQMHFIEQLKKSISESPAHASFKLLDFTDNIWDVWDACDIAVVPSTEPEPFGMVAIEAMAAGKPVIAAAHGGLLDIVVNDVTGLLVKPRDAESLSNAIASLADDAALRDMMGQAGQRRQLALFSLSSQVAKTIALYDAMLRVQ